MRSLYQARFQPDPDGGFLVTFPDVPEAITQGDDEQDAVASAMDALSVALRGYAKAGRPIPEAAAAPAPDLRPISLPLADVLKLAVLDAFRESGISKSELARRIGRVESEARRILDPDHATKLPMLEAALAALGRRAVVEIAEAA